MSERHRVSFSIHDVIIRCAQDVYIHQNKRLDKKHQCDILSAPSFIGTHLEEILPKSMGTSIFSL
jgi:hypothetical protein